MVIGTKGQTVQKIQSETNTFIRIAMKIDQGSDPPTRTISIGGEPDAVQRAWQAIMKIIGSRQLSSSGGGGRAVGTVCDHTSRGEKRKFMCAFFNRPGGCRKGAACAFTHASNADGQDAAAVDLAAPFAPASRRRN